MIKINVEIDVDGATIEDLYLAKGVLNMIDKGFQDDQIETPEWIMDKVTAINSEINSRNKAELQKKLKNAKARRAALATPDEKRSKLDEEIAILEAKVK